MDVLNDSLTDLQVITLDGEDGDLAPLTCKMRNNIIRLSKYSTHHLLKGDWAPAKSLQIWLFINASNGTFDAEIVFWADLLFPEPDNEKACVESFGKLAGLAESIRHINSSSDCVISSTETGDPRMERNEPWTLFW